MCEPAPPGEGTPGGLLNRHIWETLGQTCPLPMSALLAPALIGRGAISLSAENEAMEKASLVSVK